ncbi:MAG: hypothetical protein F7C36_00390 [Desulfurococcales archaeon]|nr:hypothetical protein [Desulfurococcales archaeon]
MVTKLYYFKTKKTFLKWCKARNYSIRACQKAWTGPGYYYARGRNHISKHVKHLDLRRGGREGKGPWRHTHDLEKAIQKLKRAIRSASLRLANRTARKTVPRKKIAKKLADIYTIKTAKKTVKAARQRWVRLKPIRQLAQEIWGWIPRRYREGKNRVWTYIMVLALARAIYRLAKERGVDPYQYDWKELIDWSLGYREALDLVRQVMGRSIEDLHREALERWKHLKQKYKDEAPELFEQELDEIARYELEHLDELLAL